MSRKRTYRPNGSPPKKPGGCIGQVTEFLAHGSGAIAAIAKAIGYSERSVEASLTLLRKAASPLMAHVLNGRLRLRVDAYLPKPRKRPPKTYPCSKPAGPIQDAALANRSELEQVWR